LKETERLSETVFRVSDGLWLFEAVVFVAQANRQYPQQQPYITNMLTVKKRAAGASSAAAGSGSLFSHSRISGRLPIKHKAV
jgi:hypothetical protein